MAENVKDCLNLKSEWAGSKNPGLKFSNPKGLRSNKEGGEEEDLDQEGGAGVYREAVRRRAKRLAYRGRSKREEEEESLSQEPQEEPEPDPAVLRTELDLG